MRTSPRDPARDQPKESHGHQARHRRPPVTPSPQDVEAARAGDAGANEKLATYGCQLVHRGGHDGSLSPDDCNETVQASMTETIHSKELSSEQALEDFSRSIQKHKRRASRYHERFRPMTQGQEGGRAVQVTPRTIALPQDPFLRLVENQFWSAVIEAFHTVALESLAGLENPSHDIIVHAYGLSNFGIRALDRRGRPDLSDSSIYRARVRFHERCTAIARGKIGRGEGDRLVLSNLLRVLESRRIDYLLDLAEDLRAEILALLSKRPRGLDV